MGKAGEMRQSWIKVKGIRGKWEHMREGTVVKKRRLEDQKWERKCRVARRGKRK